MTRNPSNERWRTNPERRVGRQQMLRAMLAGMNEADPLYREYRAMLDTRAATARPRAQRG